MFVREKAWRKKSEKKRKYKDRCIECPRRFVVNHFAILFLNPSWGTNISFADKMACFSMSNDFSCKYVRMRRLRSGYAAEVVSGGCPHWRTTYVLTRAIAIYYSQVLFRGILTSQLCQNEVLVQCRRIGGGGCPETTPLRRPPSPNEGQEK